jgi:hypothetical protein
MGVELLDLAAAGAMLLVAAIAFVIAIFFAHKLPALTIIQTRGRKVIEDDKLDKESMIKP